ncbi:hypothetical protein HMPREF0281_00600 [Corynebacterium ammoniagenes DSM 20306]|uniref:Uncharacterized protein n=1 Tax=Corynebacterium ammoniagenes DSM 20306 TaxID=649754 RepID=A0ABP2IMZ0_CORAM|nr:hypothetical protein HMPREF0281_00600 [Corynebacterium ammoniagenes DSM 20306]
MLRSSADPLSTASDHCFWVPTAAKFEFSKAIIVVCTDWASTLLAALDKLSV